MRSGDFPIANVQGLHDRGQEKAEQSDHGAAKLGGVCLEWPVMYRAGFGDNNKL
jgi:hypothetical protein